MLEAHPGTIIWTLITFLVVLVVLKKTVWKPLLQALDEREQRIRGALQEAERARAEAAATLDEHRQILAGAEEEARQIIRQSREAAAKLHQEIVDKTHVESQHLLEQARRAIDSEKRAALIELRREVADLAVRAAGLIIDANLDDEKNRKLVDDMITRLPQPPASN